MARKLKTYQTSMGFFDLAVAAPSMKAALEAWGTKTNLFHQNLAHETDDPAVVAATMAQPGIVLKRPVGSKGTFKVDAKLPSHLPDEKAAPKKRTKVEKAQRSKPDAKSEKASAAAYEREQRRRERDFRKDQAARQRQEAVIAKVQREIEKAEQDHEDRVAKIDADRAALEHRTATEDARWEKERRGLEARLRKARK